jgi:hypothetical protein
MPDLKFQYRYKIVVDGDNWYQLFKHLTSTPAYIYVGRYPTVDAVSRAMDEQDGSYYVND